MSIEIWKLRASFPWASSSGASSRLASQMMSGPRRWPGKWKMTPSNALAWQKAHQVRILATAETLAGDSGGCGYEVSMAFYGRDGAGRRFGFKKRMRNQENRKAGMASRIR